MRKRKTEGLDPTGWENLESYHPHGESQQKGEDQEENRKAGRKFVLRARSMHQLSVKSGPQIPPEVLDVIQMCPVSMEEEKEPASSISWGNVDKGYFSCTQRHQTHPGKSPPTLA